MSPPEDKATNGGLQVFLNEDLPEDRLLNLREPAVSLEPVRL